MSTYQNFIGIDAGKNHLALAVYRNNKIAKQFRIKADTKSVGDCLSLIMRKLSCQKVYFAWKLPGFIAGFYSGFSANENRLSWPKEPAQTKFSAGFHRGKNAPFEFRANCRIRRPKCLSGRLCQPKKGLLEQTGFFREDGPRMLCPVFRKKNFFLVLLSVEFKNIRFKYETFGKSGKQGKKSAISKGNSRGKCLILK